MVREIDGIHIAGENPKDRIGCLKPDLSLIPPAALIHEAMAMMNGAAKYGAYNWRDKKVQAMTYLSAAQRHIAAYQDGEENACDSKVHHLGHARACLGILLDAMEGGNLVDNRPPKGNAQQLIDRLTKRPEPKSCESPSATTDPLPDNVKLYDPATARWIAGTALWPVGPASNE